MRFRLPDPALQRFITAYYFVEVPAGPAGAVEDLLHPEWANIRFVLPKNDPFLTWAQTGAIFKDAKHPAAAKLYVSWQLSRPMASNPRGFPLRRDVAPPTGFQSIDQYKTSPEDFRAFMRDRARVERLKSLFERLIGPVQGISPLKD